MKMIITIIKNFISASHITKNYKS